MTRTRRRLSLHLESLEGRALMSGPGTLDTAFNGTGIQTANLLNGAAVVATNATAVQPDGKTVVVGSAFVKQGNRNYPAVGITRFNANGSLDTTFGNAGVVTILQGAGARGLGVALQPDGKIVVVGFTWKNTGLDDAYLVSRLNANGSLDTGFATKGTFTWSPTSGMEHAQGVAVLPDGSIAVAGYANPFSGGVTPESYTAFKLTAAGKLVTTFGTKGEFRYNFGGWGGHLNAMAVAPNGDLILAGDRLIAEGDPRRAQGFRFGAIVAVASSSGRLDTAFNGTGVLEVAPPQPSDDLTTFGYADVAIQDGKVLVAGGGTIARYTLAGAADLSFGSGGSFTATDGTSFTSLAVQADGSIVAGGSRVYASSTDPDGNTESHSEMAVAHLTAGGAIDAGFGGLGTGFFYARPDVDTGISDLVVGPGGKITACGSRYVVRLTAPAF